MRRWVAAGVTLLLGAGGGAALGAWWTVSTEREICERIEVECGVLGNRVPPPIASLPGTIDTLAHEWYDFASKYDADGMRLIVPPDLPRETIEPHDVILDKDGMAWYSNFGEQNLGRLDPKTGKVTEYQVPEHKPGFPTGFLALRADQQRSWMWSLIPKQSGRWAGGRS